MTFQLHPLAFGVMLVVAVGTLAYSLWNSRLQRNEYNAHGSREYYPDFDFDDRSSSKTSVPEDEPGSSKRKKNADRCAICLGAMKYSLRTLTCSHNFHENCIKAWFVDNNTCPICRKVTT